MSPSTPIPKIALIGAGPTSLTLATILQRHALPFTIYESSPHLRSQGGSLDLHEQGGQAALKEAGLWDEFVKVARPEGDVLKVVDIGGEVVWDGNENEGDGKIGGGNKGNGDEEKWERPEIDRGVLTGILAGALREGCVRFGKKLERVTTSATGELNKHDLHFSDGTMEKNFDIIVGADGAWSKVREFLTDVKPQYSGISTVEISANNVVDAHPWLHKFIGAGSMFAFGEGRAVQSQRQGDGSVRTYVSLRVAEDFLTTCGIDWDNKNKALSQYINQYFSDIGSDLKRSVLEQTDTLIPRTLYELPIGFTWASRPGVTLIGDAAHLMTPFAGVGVNVGMVDAMLLAREIVGAWGGEKTFDEAVKAYEEELFPRMRRFAEKTEKGKKGHFSEGGARRLAGRLREHFEGGGQEKRS